MRTTNGPESVGSPGVGGGLRITHPSKPRQILRAGRAATDTLTHSDGGELRRAGQLVGLSVLVSGHSVCQVHVGRQAQTRFPALVADEPTLGILVDASVHTRADGLADAGCGLVGVLAARCLVVAHAQAVGDRVAVAAWGRARVGW